MSLLSDQFVVMEGVRYVIGLLITIVLPGFGWAPLLPLVASRHESVCLKQFWNVGWILVSGYLLHLLVVCLLALGWLVRLRYLLVVSVLISVSGVWCQIWTGRRPVLSGRRVRALLGASGLLVVWAGLVFMAPQRSANLVGGWDPGMYVNFGIKIAHTGGMAPLVSDTYQQLDFEGRDYFSRGDGDYNEVLPALPIDLRKGDLHHYFFPLTPLAIAATAEQGGLRSALRMNLFLAGLVVVALMLFLATAGGGPVAIVGSLLAWAGVPVFFYLTHLPTTEMLQCFLVIVACIFLVRVRERGALSVWLGLVFLLAMLNRVSFLPFGAILLLSSVGMDMRGSAHLGRWKQLAPAVASLVVGLAIHHICFPETMLRLTSIMPTLYMVTGIALLLTVVLTLLPVRLRKILTGPRVALIARIVAAFGVMLFGAGVLLYAVSPNFAGNPLPMAGKLLPFLGRGVVLTGVLGLFAYLFRKQPSREMSIVFSALALITLMTLYKSFIAGIFPWASRRYLIYTVPLLVLSTACLIDQLWSIKRLRPLGVFLAMLSALVAVCGGFPLTAHALLRTEYRGVPHVINLIANQIDANDVVIVDAPKWATPLLMMHRKHVLNGKQIWAPRDETHTAEGMAILKRLADSGRRIRFLTSTRYGLSLYEGLNAERDPDWEYGPFHYQRMIQSSRGDDFAVVENIATYRLYTLYP